LLLDKVKKAFEERPIPSVDTSHVHMDEISVAATLDDLCARLPQMGKTTLRALTAEMATTSAVVACFLALLELFKRELVDLEQSGTFGSLEVTWTGGAEQHLIAGIDDYDELDTDLVRLHAER
jgi:segregation and condensation protein A